MVQNFLPARLRLARAEKGLTLRQAAERTGVAKETLSELERGLRNPHPPTLFKIAKGYGVPVERFLGDSEAAPGDSPPDEDIQWEVQLETPSEEPVEEQDIFQRFASEEERRKYVGEEFANASSQHGRHFHSMLSVAKESAKENEDVRGVDALLYLIARGGFLEILEARGITAYLDAVLNGRVKVSSRERQFCELLQGQIDSHIESLWRVAEKEMRGAGSTRPGARAFWGSS